MKVVNLTGFTVFGIVKQANNNHIPWPRVILERLNLYQAGKKFSAFCGTRRFISMFTRVRHCSYSETEQSSLPGMLILEDLFTTHPALQSD